MAGCFKLEGVCPVCGKTLTVYNPCHTMNTSAADRYKSEHYPSTIFRCYHENTSFHNNENYTYTAGTLIPMHLFFRSEGQPNYHRYYPNANDETNRRKWKAPKNL